MSGRKPKASVPIPFDPMSTDNKYELILELRRLHIREAEIRRELNDLLAELCNNNREFHNGEVVNIYTDMDKFHGEGIVTGVGLFPVTEGMDVKKFAENKELYEAHLTALRYVVKAIKKDGTASTKSACHSRSLSGTPTRHGYYITKKQL